MILWFPARVDNHTCLIYLQSWMHDNKYRYPHRLQDIVNARFPSYDKREVHVEIIQRNLRLKQKCNIQYEVNQHNLLGEKWFTAVAHSNI